MKTAIISPHADDAIFSLGSHMTSLEDVTIISPFCGIPIDQKGANKHRLLNKEHEKACSVVGAKFVNGYFLDDVYPGLDEIACKNWLLDEIKGFDEIYAPLGIRHPDHIFISDITLPYATHVYAELPYRLNYPSLYKERLDAIRCKPIPVKSHDHSKVIAILEYKSQIQGEIIKYLFGDEEVYKL